MMKKLTLVLGALFAFGIMSANAASAHPGKSKNNAVATTTLSIRACPSTSCYRKGKIRSHTKVRVLGCRRGWCKVSYRGRVGFSAMRYLRPAGHTHRGRGHGRRGHGNGFYFQLRLNH